MRILYLLNHKTLTDFEVPILLKNGHEVYINKNSKGLDKNNSTNFETVRRYDDFCSIPKLQLKALNTINFHDPSLLLSNGQMDLINSHFDCIFLTLLVREPLLNQLLENFEGKMYFRFFGVAANHSYKNIIHLLYGTETVFKKDKPCPDKINFIFSYQECLEFEMSNPDNNSFFNEQNSFVAPLGLPKSFIIKYWDSHSPINKKVCIVNSRSDDGIDSYYGKKFLNVISILKDFDFIVLGKNNSKYKHLNFVMDNLPDSEYFKTMSSCSLMYYDSTENTHLHYHPLEAAIIGLPVIFHKESLLSSFFPKSPGRCSSVKEAISKIEHILSNRSNLSDSIKKYQHCNVDNLTIDRNIEIFNKIIN